MSFEDLLVTIGISSHEKACYVLTKLSMTVKLTGLLLTDNTVLLGSPWMLTFAIKIPAVRQGKFSFSTSRDPIQNPCLGVSGDSATEAPNTTEAQSADMSKNTSGRL